jgi:hypothetical protein
VAQERYFRAPDGTFRERMVGVLRNGDNLERAIGFDELLHRRGR